MSDPLIFKKDLTTYERWEMPVFNGSLSQHSKNKNSSNVVLPTALEIEEMQRQAHEEGYLAGFAEGAQRMTALLAAMEQALQQTDLEIAQDLLTLALGVAQQMVQQTLKTKPEILLNVIREAISSLPHFNQGAHLLLHPDDAAMVRTNIGEQLSHTGWKIIEDPQISHGGVRVETAHSQIDATVDKRWQRIVASIGQDSSWIQE
jgi:flagellar assembly protein FliH